MTSIAVSKSIQVCGIIVGRGRATDPGHAVFRPPGRLGHKMFRQRPTWTRRFRSPPLPPKCTPIRESTVNVHAHGAGQASPCDARRASASSLLRQLRRRSRATAACSVRGPRVVYLARCGSFVCSTVGGRIVDARTLFRGWKHMFRNSRTPPSRPCFGWTPGRTPNYYTTNL